MAISIKTHKMLWGRAANRCAICKAELVADSSETDDESIIGEACHIVAQSKEGPRGTSVLTPEQRDKFANLILLCNVHHKQIDDQPNTFTVEKLTATKLAHESWVSEQLGFDEQKQHDDRGGLVISDSPISDSLAQPKPYRARQSEEQAYETNQTESRTWI